MPLAGRLALALARALAAAAVLAAAGPGCKPSAPAPERVQLGPLPADRYHETSSEGAPLDCYLLGADSNKPVRLCGEPSVVPGGGAVLFLARAPSPAARFVTAAGEPLPAGAYLLRPAGRSAVDAWGLGRIALREWLADGKLLLGLSATPDHHTHVRLFDPAERSERDLDVGPMRGGEGFLLLRAPRDESLLLVQRQGGEELILVRDPTGRAEVTVADARLGSGAGSRKLSQRGQAARQAGTPFVVGPAELAAFGWKAGSPLFEGSPLGPFEAPSATLVP